MRAGRIAMGFLAYGLVVGVLSARAWYPGLDGPFALPYLLNLPGELLGNELFSRLGRPGAPLGGSPVAWALRPPPVYVPASAAFWGLAGLAIWAGWAVLLRLDRWLIRVTRWRPPTQA